MTTHFNRELRMAGEYVEHTNHHVYLTGKAGTGKTTFLHTIKQNSAKRLIVTAPTGVAAINAGGVTLHSFFQLPLGMVIPGSEAYEHYQQRWYRFNKQKIGIIRNLDLLIIDEISMVRADILDAVDDVLRRIRRNHQPFGGVQLLMIGDLHQLSPVVRPDERPILAQFYESPYFFSSRALAGVDMITIELKHIYRQTDDAFIQLLNRVRDNRLDPTTIAQLNQRYIPNFTPDSDQGYLVLTTHNATADAMNQQRLHALRKREKCFLAEISGDFPESNYPTPAELRLKEGAQVMFLRNDTSGEQRYFNGKIGKITRLTSKSISVICPGDMTPIEVEPAEWENIQYTVDPDTKEIRQEIVGRFRQFPLKLAWAITIHKSQGLTFDKAIIDARDAFAQGQVYVALSRCRSLDGLVLSSPIMSNGIQMDQAIVHFDTIANEHPPDENHLQNAKMDYQRRILLDCFNFQKLQNHLNHLTGLTIRHANVAQIVGVADLPQVRQMAQETILGVGNKFIHQLKSIFSHTTLPEADGHVLERIGKASSWYQEQLQRILGPLVENGYVETDNKEIHKTMEAVLGQVKNEFRVKLAGIKTFENGFSPTRYLKAIASAAEDTTPQNRKKRPAPEYTAADIEHPDLFRILKDWRSQKAKEQGVPHYQIMHQRVLIQIATLLPGTAAAMRKINGIGEKTMEKYGLELLKIVTSYRDQHGITGVVIPKKQSPENPSTNSKNLPSNTREITLDLFQKGLSVERIAKERGLAVSTIQGHLGCFVENGQLEIQKVLAPEKQCIIEAQLDAGSDNYSLSQIKNALGDDYSYGEIKLVLAHRKYQEKK